MTRLLVDGLEEIGRSLLLQVFTAPNGIALLDWVPDEHRVLTLWVHHSCADLRLGSTIHTVVPVTTPEQVDHLLGVVRQALVDGAWHEAFVFEEETGEFESLTWRLGTGASAAHSLPRVARPANAGVRIRRRGAPWGPHEREADLDTS